MKFDFNELRELLMALDQTDIAEFTLKGDDFELVVRKGAWVKDSTLFTPPMVPPTAAAPASIAASAEPAAVPVPPVVSSPAAAPPGSETKYVDILSPMVGTFYRSPAPDEPSYVEVGDRVQPRQAVCIIEAMKLMNEIEAEVSGEIVEILAQNGAPVEYGQVLMRVNPG